MEKQNVADKWDEITQLEEAYNALKTQPRDAQLRMLAWLNSRLDHDYEKTMEAKKEALRNRSPGFAVNGEAPRD